MQKGFSLVELMVAISVTLILASVAVPSFTAVMQGVRASSVADKMITALHFTRSEAIGRNARVSLCASENGINCDGGNWDKGWIVTWQNPDLALGSQTERLKVWQIKVEEAEVELAGVGSHQIVFNARGEAARSVDGIALLSDAIAMFSQIENCAQLSLSLRRDINVTPFGSIRVSKGACL